MKIRYTLLISYFFISLASVLLITLLIFVHLRDMLRSEITDKLQSQANTIMQQIDTALFDRMENMVLWSQLDVMRTVKNGDVDKHLTHLLVKLQEGSEGVYQRIFVVNTRGIVIASSDGTLLGQLYPRQTAWLEVADDEHTHHLATVDQQHNYLSFSLALPNSEQNGEVGYLYAETNWDEINNLLSKNLSNGAYALLIDREQRVLSVSKKIAHKVPVFQPLTNSLHLTTPSRGLFLGKKVLVSRALSAGHLTFTGFGWQVIIAQPVNIALAPIWDLWLVILLFLCLTLLLGIMISFWMSSQIARPIVQLADFTRDFMQGKRTEPPKLRASLEIKELVSQFARMIDHLEQSRLERERVAKLAVIGEMAASMAHEVRTPLGILRSSAQILQQESQLSPIGVEMTEFILSETKRLNALVTTLLECAKPRASHFIQQNVYHIIEHTLELLKNQITEKAAIVELKNHSTNLLLYCDHDQLLQVFLNLIMNALQHSEPNGHIVIGSQQQETHLEITIADNGSGICDADKTRVFEPFYTQRQEGIGLGLTVVQQIILAHHGKIFVTDSAEGGACFHIVLPLATDLTAPNHQ